MHCDTPTTIEAWIKSMSEELSYRHALVITCSFHRAKSSGRVEESKSLQLKTRKSHDLKIAECQTLMLYVSINTSKPLLQVEAERSRM